MELIELLMHLSVCSFVSIVAYCIGKVVGLAQGEELRGSSVSLIRQLLIARDELSKLHGLWATDQPRLIKHHAEREKFFRIGHPEDRL